MRRIRQPDRLCRLTSKPSIIPMLTFLVALLSTAFLSAPAYASNPASEGYGTVGLYSTFSLGDVLTDGYRYSDDWFSQAPEDCNDALALASMQLVASAVEGDADGTAATFLECLGFDDIGFEGFDTDDPSDFAYTWGRKDVGGDSLYVIAVQSYSFNDGTKLKGWRQNFTVNGDPNGADYDVTSGEHYAFSLAVDSMMDSIIQLSDGQPAKYWICGQSRGGAIANILASRLPDVLATNGVQNDGIYAYTFEAPATVDADAIQDADAYDYIHNYRCSDDIVSRVPMWDMVLYGHKHELKTTKTDAKVVSELERLGSTGAENELTDSTDMIDSLIASLEERVPTRADYSKVRTDTFEGGGGSPVGITYSYQEMLCDLMGMTFGGELGGLSTDTVIDNIADLLPSVHVLVDAVQFETEGNEVEAIPRYWEAAQGLRNTISAWVGHNVSMSDEDFYAMLRLIGPISVDLSWEEDDGSDFMNVTGYLSPLLSIAMGSDSMTYSHHFDTLVARLHALSPMNKLANQYLTITAPEAGDVTGKAPSELSVAFADLTDGWTSADVAWLTEEETLGDDSIQYLTARFSAVAHDIAGDWDVRLNGKSPVDAPSVVYKDGVSTATVTWEFVLGDPADMSITFDTTGHDENPEAMSVKQGKMLRYLDAPQLQESVVDDGITWMFGGWYDENGTSWDDIRVDGDLTVHARWIRVIDNVDITISDMEIGKMPTIGVSDGAPYHATVGYMSDSTWNTVDSIGSAGQYHLDVSVETNDPETMMFLSEFNEWEGHDYTGTLTVNGSPYDGEGYDHDSDLIYFTYDFEVTDDGSNSVTPREGEKPVPESVDGDSAENALYRFIQGDGQQWHKKSGRCATFVVKRSEDDEKTHDLFTGVVLGGASIKGDTYEVEKGSLILKLKPEYLDTLVTGRYQLTVRFQDGDATALLRIEDAEEAKTIPSTGTSGSKGTDGKQATSKRPLAKMGDENPITLLIGLVAVGLGLLIVGYAVKKRKDG